MKIMVAIFVTHLFSTQAFAQAFYSGVGSYNCQKFLFELSHSETRVAVFSWAQGYIAGINVAAINNHGYYYDTSELSGMAASQLITVFCRSNLEKPLIAASDSILAALPKVQWVEN